MDGRKQDVKPLHIKRVVKANYDVTTSYFLCEVIQGQISYQDPDDSIVEIAWKKHEEVSMLQHGFPEDKNMLLSFFDDNPTEVKNLE